MPPTTKRRGTRVSDFGLSKMGPDDSSSSSSSSDESVEAHVLAGNFGKIAKRHHENISLQECVRNNDVTMLTRLLQSQDGLRLVNKPDEYGQTPLHYAAKANNFKLCTTLIQAGADVTCTDEDGAAPLHYACRRKLLTHNEETVRVIRLLARHNNFNFNMTDKFGSTPLHFAAMRGNLVAAKALLKDSNVMVHYQDQHGCTPLHEAATYSQMEVAELLIERESDVKALDNDKCTPLHLACVDGSLDMVRLLLKRCEKGQISQLVEAKDKDDTTALHYAVESRNMDIIKLLIINGAQVNGHCRWKTSGCTALHLSAVAGERNITELLIQKGAKIEATDNRNCTPLHAAAQYNNQSVSDILLAQLKSNVNQLDVEGRTPLMIAVKYGSEDILKALLNAGADVAGEDKYEKNALHLAVESLQDNALKILLEHIKGTKHEELINDQDRNGQTPLHLAAQKGNLKLVEMLLDAGADLACKDETEETPFLQAAETGIDAVIREMLVRNERIINDEDEFSNTALHKAAENGHQEVAKTLIEWGAVREARNNHSWTPLDIAASNGHANIVKFLLREDVSPNPQDKNRSTPLHLAAKSGHAETVKALIAGGADVAAVNVNKENCLDVAIANNHRYVVIAILKSRAWHIALANETQKEIRKPRITPLRKLVKKMPDIVPLALTQCMTEGNDPLDGEYLEFNYDYVDDTYIDYMALRTEKQTCEFPETSYQKYCKDKNWIKDNHPLSRLSMGDKKEHEDLICHPLILALIRHKWISIRVFYFLFLVFFAAYVGLLTGYMISAQAPYLVVNVTECQLLGTTYENTFQVVVMYLIWIMSGIGIIIEVIQAISQGWLYFEFTNLVDWYTYISASVVVADLSDTCGLKTKWQWQMGSFTVLFAWMAMLLFLRRLPGLGLYVVMIVEIMKTFMKFFVVFFLFVVAFAISFHILLQNQDPFSTPFYAITKTWVMMLGEMEYGGIFHENTVVYEKATFAMFWLFLALMAIIVMNLLTGLAVDDVNLLQQKAKLVKLRLQIELALAIELAIPKLWRRSTKISVRRERIYKHKDSSMCQRVIENLEAAVEGPLLSKRAVIDAANEMTDSNSDESLEHFVNLESRLSHGIFSNREQIMGLHKKLDQIEQLLRLQAMSRDTGGLLGLSSDWRDPGTGGDDGGTPGTPRSGKGRKGSTTGSWQAPKSLPNIEHPDDVHVRLPPEVPKRTQQKTKPLKKKASAIISGMSFGRVRSDSDSLQGGGDSLGVDNLGFHTSEHEQRKQKHKKEGSQKVILSGSDGESETIA